MPTFYEANFCNFVAKMNYKDGNNYFFEDKIMRAVFIAMTATANIVMTAAANIATK